MCGDRYLRKGGSQSQQVVMCAVILDEWLKELAAISQEHTVCIANIFVIVFSVQEPNIKNLIFNVLK